MASTDSRPVPRKATAFRVYFGFFKNDGSLITSPSSLVASVSKDGGNFATASGTPTQIQTSGVYYLDLTGSANGEMDADCVVVKITDSTTGMVATIIPLYPQETGDIKVDVDSYKGTSATASSGRPEVNATHIDGVSATALRRAFENMTVLTINGTPTNTTCPNSTLSNSNNDKYKGRPLYYLTGNLAGEVVEVTAYNGTTKTLTHTAAPSGLSATAGDLAILA